MSSRLRMSLVAGIATLQTHERRIIDARYTGSPLWKLEDPEWQNIPINPPPYEGPYPAHGDQEYALWRAEFIQENLLNRLGLYLLQRPDAWILLYLPISLRLPWVQSPAGGLCPGQTLPLLVLEMKFCALSGFSRS